MSSSGGERFARIEVLFHGALGEPVRERASWLEQRVAEEGWGDDPELIPEVLALVEADEADAPLEGIVVDRLRDAAGMADPAATGGAHARAADWDPDAETLDVGAGEDRRSQAYEGDPEKIGPYRILGRLGRGGLATVYLAERRGEFSMPVALKRIRRGMDTDDILERLRLERQILARLVHPNIARIHDGGSDEAGRPYLVMEVIEGERIDLWCGRRRLPLERRLELFEGVLDAVGYAHRNLVLHRDLKPSNILVTEEGVPKLLDFGIAKLLRGEPDGAGDGTGAAGRAATVTGFEHRLLTPEYASPEQILGQPLTTASDVYSLGVLLFELASGVSPHHAAAESRSGRHRGKSPEAPWARPGSWPPSWPATLSVAEIPRVSQAARRAREQGSVEVPPLDRFVAEHTTELDAVVAKALDPDPMERYGSAREMAEDLERLRSDLPVLARQASWAYRARKWVRRHRTSAGVAALVLLSILAAVVGTTWQARVAEKERQQAEARRLEAEDLGRFLVDLFAVSDPYASPSALELGARAAPSGAGTRGEAISARELLDRAARTIDSDLEADSARRRSLRMAIGRAYLNLSLAAEARSQLEKVLAEGPAELDLLGATAQRELALIDALDGRFDPAVGRLNSAESALTAALGAGHPELALLAERRGDVALLAGEPQSAEDAFLRALEIYPQASGSAGGPEADARPPDPDAAARMRTGLGRAYYRQDRLEEAAVLFEQVLEDRRSRLGETHPRFVESANNLALTSSRAGDFAAAEEVFERLLERQRRLLGDRHRELAPILYNLAKTLERQGRYPEARVRIEEARELASVLASKSQLMSWILMLEGLIADRVGDPLVALAAYRHALDLSRQLFPGDHPQTVTVLIRLGKAGAAASELVSGFGAIREAESALREALAMAGRIDPKQVLEVHLAIGDLALAQGRAGEAEIQFAHAAELLRDAPQTWMRGLVSLRQATALAALGRPGESQSMARLATDQLAAALGPDHAWTKEARALAGPGSETGSGRDEAQGGQ